MRDMKEGKSMRRDEEYGWEREREERDKVGEEVKGVEGKSNSPHTHEHLLSLCGNSV